MRILKSIIQRTLWSSAILFGSVTGFAQEEPPVPVFIPGSSPIVESTSQPGSDAANTQNPASIGLASSKISPAALANKDFQANFQKPFVGQVRGSWPPSFSISRTGSYTSPSAKTQAPAADSIAPPVPSLPQSNAEPEKASVNPPVSQFPGFGFQRQYAPSRPMNQTPPAVPAVRQDAPSTPAPAAAVPQNATYSSPTISTQTPTQIYPTRMQTGPAPVQKSEYMFSGGSICPLNIRPTQPGEHPMAALIPWATEGLQTFNAKIKDYSCVMIKRERIDGQLQDSSTLFMKIREQPFSIYVKYLKPDRKAGVEALYRKGYHNDQLLGHDVGFRAIAGSLWLDPNGRLAMAGQKYPITDGGIPNLVRKMMETVRLDMKNDPEGKETFVKFVEDGGEIDGRPCIRVDVMHPVKRSCYRFYRAEICLDKEWGIPVRYAAWMWPAYQGGRPVLDEEFTYTKLQFNRGFTDWDFNERNREYKF
ncbi:MAG: DUF1571 domain-containing protein [Thermoguttaceae bacterium]|nr:DUF1571 domain-containing protein [Thermoguttaceae bacterium]